MDTGARTEARAENLTNGAAAAAYVSAGIGALAMGLFVFLNEIGVYTAPSLYAPAGGVTGRTTFAVIVWLIAWAVMHNRWKGKAIASGSAVVATVMMILLGVLLTFPPFWAMLS